MIWLLVLCSPLIYWIVKFIYYESYLRKFPGPTPWPIVGSALEFNTTKKIMETLSKYRKKYNGSYRIYMGFDPMVVVTDVKSVEYFLGNTTANAFQKKSKHYAFFRKWLRYGLLVSNGEYWKRHRRIITPAFHFSVLKQYVKIFDSVSDVLVEALKPNLNETVNIYPFVKLASLDTLCEAAMGSSVNALVNSDSSYVRSVERMGKIIVERIFSAAQSIDFFYQFSNNAKIEAESLKVMHDYTGSVVGKKKSELSEKETVDTTETKKEQAFLDLLLNYSIQGENLADEEIKEEVDTFMFAGHDTTSSALAFTLYSISKDQRVQNKINEELSRIFADDPRRPTTYEDLQEMKYLELVVKETLRVYPSVPFHFREVTEDIVFDGKTYPKGVIIAIYNYGMHHDPNYFPDPERFYPERFETESNPYRTGGTFSYVPFSAGARNCIGQKFAMLQLKSTVSKVLRHYQLMPCSDHQLDLANETVLISLNGVPMHLLPRSQI